MTNPTLTVRQLLAAGTRIGRDHIASTVNTLVLAYAGASLPLLLFFAQGTQPTGRLLTGEVVASFPPDRIFASARGNTIWLITKQSPKKLEIYHVK